MVRRSSLCILSMEISPYRWVDSAGVNATSRPTRARSPRAAREGESTGRSSGGESGSRRPRAPLDERVPRRGRERRRTKDTRSRRRLHRTQGGRQHRVGRDLDEEALFAAGNPFDRPHMRAWFAKE